MTNFKTTKQSLYSTPFDVRQILGTFERDVINDDDEITVIQSIRNQRIEQQIAMSDAMIWGYLAPTYGSSNLNSETPYFLGPVPLEKNSSSGTLRGIIVASSAVTEEWLVSFSDIDTFSVSGSFSGSQGSGTTGADFTSTNGDIQIKAEDWDFASGSVIKADNRFLVGTYISHPIVRTLSAKCAAAGLIDALYSVHESSQSSWSRDLKSQCKQFLKALIDPDSGVSLNDTNAADISKYEAVAWTIDENGNDATPYLDIEGDVNPMDQKGGSSFYNA